MDNPVTILAILLALTVVTGGFIIYFFVQEKKKSPSLQLKSEAIEHFQGPKDKKITLREYQQGKTIWDLIQLIIIPVMLVILTTVFSLVQSANNSSIALDQQEQTTLDTYISQMSNLLVGTDVHPNLHDSRARDEVRKVARTLTLLALSRLDPERKGDVIIFLYQADLITWIHYPGTPGFDFPIVHLQNADLSGADLSGLFLDNVDLHDTDLTNANLSNSIINDANLSMSMLKNANLSNANIEHTDLHGCDLRGTNRTGTNLQGSNLQGTLQ